MNRIVTLTVAGRERTVRFPDDWADMDLNARIAWLSSWAGNHITNIMIDMWGSDNDE